MLVDDEFSTGNTVLNTIRALHETHPRERYVIVALVDMRSAADRDRLTAFAAEIGARVDLVTRSSGTVTLPEGVLERGQALVADQEAEQAGRADETVAASAPAPAPVTRVALDWPAEVPDGGRHGFTPAHRAALEAALPGMAERIAGALRQRPPAACSSSASRS
ncbi:Phosphoribosyltransferase OS=Streptomyces cyaneofuscatus OX=66883 GN=G3I52_05525 PE=4 SV=1 [Streptomyces cyaneofuscatus]